MDACLRCTFGREFQCLESLCEDRFGRFAKEEMDVLGHDDVAGDKEVVTEAHGFEGALE